MEFVIDLLANDWTESDIIHNYPRLTHEDIQAGLIFASALMKSERIYSHKIEQDGPNAALGGRNYPDQAIELLRKKGHDVLSISECQPRACGEDIEL